MSSCASNLRLARGRMKVTYCAVPTQSIVREVPDDGKSPRLQREPEEVHVAVSLSQTSYGPVIVASVPKVDLALNTM